jgi:hypothetical protein
MDGKHYHNITWIPVLVIGLSALFLGGVYTSINHPWLLDQRANELLLGIRYDDLFSQKINQFLPGYLTLMYRFFGWWLVSIGLLISTYVFITKMGTPLARNGLHVILFIILVGMYCIEFTFIPTTPFLWLTHGISLLLVMSVFGSIKLKRFE